MKQTAVEWLEEQCPRIKTFVAYSILEQAKEMEKKQIEMAFRKGFITEQWDKTKENKSKQYYNETFKSE
jgi:hypothetical protein